MWCGKLDPCLYMLGKLRCFINAEIAVQIYKSYILPVVETDLYLLDFLTKFQERGSVKQTM